MAKLYEAFRSLRKDASAGIDGVTYEQYEAHAEENIRQLHQRLKEGKYRAQPLRRVYIPKEDGKQRPISIPALEDKVVQKTVVDLLNAIYEQDFLDCSYGFRPKRGQHQALDEIGRIICNRPIAWVLLSCPGDFVSTDATLRVRVSPTKWFGGVGVGANVFPQFAS